MQVIIDINKSNGFEFKKTCELYAIQKRPHFLISQSWTWILSIHGLDWIRLDDCDSVL